LEPRSSFLFGEVGEVMALTEKQKRFADEYLIDLNATQAALRAGYSKKTAYSIGQENLKKPEIQTYIQERQKEREKRTEITQDQVLAELAKIGFASITDFLEYKTVQRVIEYRNGEPVIDWAMMVDAIDSSEVDGAAISEISVSKDGTFKFKLHNKLDALDKLGRHLGLFEKSNVPNDEREDDNLWKAIAEAVKRDEV